MSLLSTHDRKSGNLISAQVLLIIRLDRRHEPESPIDYEFDDRQPKPSREQWASFLSIQLECRLQPQRPLCSLPRVAPKVSRAIGTPKSPGASRSSALILTADVNAGRKGFQELPHVKNLLANRSSLQNSTRCCAVRQNDRLESRSGRSPSPRPSPAGKGGTNRSSWEVENADGLEALFSRGVPSCSSPGGRGVVRETTLVTTVPYSQTVLRKNLISSQQVLKFKDSTEGQAAA